jgi:hypothetical protein
MFDLKTATMPPEPEFYNAFVNKVKGEGCQEGRQEGEAELIIRLLNRRCGTLSESLITQVRSLFSNKWVCKINYTVAIGSRESGVVNRQKIRQF